MVTQTQNQVERENRKSGLVGKVVAFPLVGFFTNRIQERIYGKSFTKVWATATSAAIEGAVAIKLWEVSPIASVVFGAEAIFRGPLYAFTLLDDTNARYNCNEGLGSIEGYIPGKIIEAGIKAYEKYKSRKQGGNL